MPVLPGVEWELNDIVLKKRERVVGKEEREGVDAETER